MTDFLLELLSEEIPARMQAKACADLAQLFETEISKAGLRASAIETYAAPRRLALIARDLPIETQAVSEEIKGPKSSAPPQALEGFLRKTGLTRDQLTERDGILFAIIDKPGRKTAQVLAEAIPAIVRAFPWPKSMRWGTASASTASLRWVRPLKGIIALLGDDVVPFEIDGIASGAETLGHRFHHPGVITIGNAGDYAAKLRACHVILDPQERQEIIRAGAANAAAKGLSVIPDDGLVAENAGLTEWPVPLLGAFDPAFLEVPREVIQLTMRTNQKYFALTDGEGKLAPNFICTANIDAVDGGAAIVAGNAKVLAARLSDAKFFWEQDLKVPLEENAKKLSQIVFHEKLGTVADKVERVAKLARWLVEEGIIKPSPLQGRGLGEGQSSTPLATANPLSPTFSPDGEKERLAALAEQAARLAKADLVTGMVGEFPELQGIMGGYYARAEGLPDEVADAIRDHYGVPWEPVSVALALADRLDILREFFRIGEKPTGSKDPFALRRAGIQTIFMIMRGLRIDLSKILGREIIDFLIERWAVQNKSGGGRADLLWAVRGSSQDGDLYRLGLRMRALEEFVTTDDGANLLAGYKRASNILKKENVPLESQNNTKEEQKELSYRPEIEESALMAALDSAEPEAERAVEAEDFAGAMAALATLRGPIDAFFDKVTVNDPDQDKRAHRLALLARVRRAVHRVADFSRIEG
jgi:glycyl-tRNA synthetase beta chain